MKKFIVYFTTAEAVILEDIYKSLQPCNEDVDCFRVSCVNENRARWESVLDDYTPSERERFIEELFERLIASGIFSPVHQGKAEKKLTALQMVVHLSDLEIKQIHTRGIFRVSQSFLKMMENCFAKYFQEEFPCDNVSLFLRNHGVSENLIKTWRNRMVSLGIIQSIIDSEKKFFIPVLKDFMKYSLQNNGESESVDFSVNLIVKQLKVSLDGIRGEWQAIEGRKGEVINASEKLNEEIQESLKKRTVIKADVIEKYNKVTKELPELEKKAQQVSKLQGAFEGVLEYYVLQADLENESNEELTIPITMEEKSSDDINNKDFSLQKYCVSNSFKKLSWKERLAAIAYVSFGMNNFTSNELKGVVRKNLPATEKIPHVVKMIISFCYKQKAKPWFIREMIPIVNIVKQHAENKNCGNVRYYFRLSEYGKEQVSKILGIE